MKKKYISPQIDTMVFADNDILNGSDVLIDGSSLFSEENQ